MIGGRDGFGCVLPVPKLESVVGGGFFGLSKCRLLMSGLSPAGDGGPVDEKD
jgi:hypothetical protein